MVINMTAVTTACCFVTGREVVPSGGFSTNQRTTHAIMGPESLQATLEGELLRTNLNMFDGCYTDAKLLTLQLRLGISVGAQTKLRNCWSILMN